MERRHRKEQLAPHRKEQLAPHLHSELAVGCGLIYPDRMTEEIGLSVPSPSVVRAGVPPTPTHTPAPHIMPSSLEALQPTLSRVP